MHGREFAKLSRKQCVCEQISAQTVGWAARDTWKEIHFKGQGWDREEKFLPWVQCVSGESLQDVSVTSSKGTLLPAKRKRLCRGQGNRWESGSLLAGPVDCYSFLWAMNEISWRRACPGTVVPLLALIFQWRHDEQEEGDSSDVC